MADISSDAATGAAAGSILPGLGTLAGGAIGAIGGLIGSIFSGADQDKAKQAMLDAMKRIQDIGAPPDLAKQLLLQQFKQVGLYTPQLEQGINVAYSNAANVQEDPSLKQAQSAALGQLQQLSKSGLGPQELADMAKVQQSNASDSEGKRQQIIQNMQARGQAGSGAELASALQASQGGANNLANQQLNVAGQAGNRALQALASSGSLSGQIRGQDFSNNMAKAQAADALAQFNTQNSINRQQRNVATQNQAQQQNLQTQQQLNNANTLMANEEARRQAQAQRDYWNDLLKQQGMIAGAETGQSNYYQGLANQTKQGVGNIAGGVSDVLTGYLDAQDKANQRQANTNQLLPNPTQQNPLSKQISQYQMPDYQYSFLK